MAKYEELGKKIEELVGESQFTQSLKEIELAEGDTLEVTAEELAELVTGIELAIGEVEGRLKDETRRANDAEYELRVSKHEREL